MVPKHQREDTLIIDQRRVQFGRVLATARKDRRISQTELGRRLGGRRHSGVGQATISNWESGCTLPTVEQLLDLEELLEVDLLTALGREPIASRCAADYFDNDPHLPEWARPVAHAMYIALCKPTDEDASDH